MILIKRLGYADLIELCRSMRYPLSSGLMLRDVMELLAERGTPRVRLVAEKVAKELKAGWSLPDALAKQSNVLPPLFISLATVGEESGNLPEVLAELERYYILQQKLRQEFVEQIASPVLQFVAAILIVSVLIFVLGILPAPRERGSKPIDPLGLGLTGTRGALTFLGSVTGIVLATIVLFFAIKRVLQRRAIVERVLLLIPAIGPCFRASAVARLCLAGRLMLETSLSVLKTLRLAFLATDNAAFIAEFPRVEGSLRKGNSITTSFSILGVSMFPQRFLSAVAVGEESGKLPETLRYQGEEYDEEARRRLTWLTRLASWIVWMGVATIVIVCIFRIFTIVYLGNIEKVLPK